MSTDLFPGPPLAFAIVVIIFYLLGGWEKKGKITFLIFPWPDAIACLFFGCYDAYLPLTPQDHHSLISHQLETAIQYRQLSVITDVLARLPEVGTGRMYVCVCVCVCVCLCVFVCVCVCVCVCGHHEGV